MNQTKHTKRRQATRIYALTVLLLCVFGAAPEAARGQWTTNGTNIRNENTGNVGIGTGTTPPSEKLVVTGNSLFGGATARTELWQNFSSYSNLAFFEINSNASVSDDTRFAALSLVTKQAGTGNAIGAIYFSNSFITAADKRVAVIGTGTEGAVNSGVLTFSTANGNSPLERLRITPAGNVGIGTYAPAARLSVRDDGGVDGNRYLLNLHRERCANASTGNGISFSDWGFNTQASILALRQNCSANFFSDLVFSVNTGAYGSDPDTTLTEVMRVGASRRVGIGTNNAQSRLHVNGAEATEFIRIQSTAIGTAGTFDIYTSGTGGFLAGTSGFNTGSAGSPIAFALGGAEVMRVTNGSLGIGTATPATKLDVQGGQINASGGLCIAGDCRTAWSNVSPWATSGANINFNTGNVGIGTATPSHALHISRTGADLNNLAYFNIKTTGTGGYGSGMYLDSSSIANGRNFAVLSSGSLDGVGAGKFNIYDVTANTSRLVIDDGGSVGIGTTVPTTFGGSIGLSGMNLNVTSAASIARVVMSGATASELHMIRSGNAQNDRNYRFSVKASDLTLDQPVDGYASAQHLMTWKNDGKVGIATTSPAALLHIVGTADASLAAHGLAVFGATTTPNIVIDQNEIIARNNGVAAALHLNNDGGDVIINGSGAAGNVGIGTTTAPGTKLDVAGKIKSSEGFVFPDGSLQTSAATGGGIVPAGNVSQGQFGAGNFSFPGNLDINGTLSWGGGYSRTERKNNAGLKNSKSGFFETDAPENYPAGATGWWHLVESRHTNTDNNYALQIAGKFDDQNLYMRKTNDSGTTPWSKFILQDSSGNVGIGTTTPLTALHVMGDITVSGNINAKYQDVAEWVPSSQQLAAGTVVALDPERSNHVLASAQAYDTSVAGVISAQPGISLGERGEGKVLVATTGRVKVKVDATRAPIRIGDLLVTSDVQGVAMKSEPIAVGGRRMHSPGTLIGKALEPLAKGTGEILVLLSLQ